MAGSGFFDDDLSLALSELAAAREAPHHDEAADAAARTEYYAGLDHDLGPDDLFAALSRLVTQTHTVELEYKPAVHLYPAVDLQANGRLRSIYTGDEFDPEVFIHDDVEVAGQRSQVTLYFLVRYPGTIEPDEGPLDPSRIDGLLSWHESFEVTDHERHRNAVFQSKQGNRNPLVDAPSLAAKVNFQLGLPN